jgi:hypothetical protein
MFHSWADKLKSEQAAQTSQKRLDSIVKRYRNIQPKKNSKIRKPQMTIGTGEFAE